MRLGDAELEVLLGHALEAAREAARIIAAARPRVIETKVGGSSLASSIVTEVDRRSEAAILEILAPTLERFELALLSEEREDDRLRLRRDHFWCIDPLDGTLPFVEGTPGYAVSIALVDRQGVPRLGVVHDPVDGTQLHAVRGQGIVRDGEPWDPAAGSRASVLSVFPDRSFVDDARYDGWLATLEEVARGLGLGGVEAPAVGGAVMNACRVLAHPPACIFKLPKPQDGGGSLWDYAATACLFHEAGFVATDFHGGPLDLNRLDSTFMSHRGVLFATDQALARRLRAALLR